MQSVTITCDGSGTTAGHPGGYAAVLRSGDNVREVVGGCDDCTNNRMELMAAISGLEALKFPCRVTLRSDSEYVVLGISEGRAKKWQAKGWKRREVVCVGPKSSVISPPRPVPNADLWERLLSALAPHSVTCVWVRGHSGDPDNERCDKLAGAERARRLSFK